MRALSLPTSSENTTKETQCVPFFDVNERGGVIMTARIVFTWALVVPTGADGAISARAACTKPPGVVLFDIEIFLSEKSPEFNKQRG